MLGFRNLSLRRKQTLIMMLTSSVVLLLACASFITYDTFTFRRELRERVTVLADAIGNNCAAAIDFKDLNTAEEALAALHADNNIVSACVYSHDGQVFAVYQRDRTSPLVFPVMRDAGQEFTDNELHVFRPVKQQGERVGVIFVASDLKALSARLVRYSGIVGVVFLVSLLVALVLSNQAQRLVSDPILHLALVARSVALEKNYSLRATRQSNDELGQLVDGFNEMLGQIQERDIALQTARANLEHRVAERTGELASSVALLNATLEASVDGIVAQDLTGKITSYNQKFAELWRYPDDVLARRDQEELVALAVSQLKDARVFIARVEPLQASPEREDFDILEFQDGRTVERLSKPQYIGDQSVGSVVTYRDITDRKRIEEAVRESQALYYSLVEQLPTGVFRNDAAGRYVFANSWFYRLKGMTAEQILGKTPHELLSDLQRVAGVPRPGESEARLATQADEHHRFIMRTGTHVEVEEEHPSADGTVRYLHVLKTPVFAPGGRIVGSQGIMFDITERKQAAEVLRRTEELYRSAISGAGAVPYSYDLQSRSYTFMGEGIQQLTGYAPKEMNGDLWKRIIQESIMLGDAAGLDKAEAARRVDAGGLLRWRCDMLVTTRDGQSRWISDASVQNLDESGRVTGSVGILQDITERKEAEAEMESIHKQLVEASRRGGMAEIATNVLHNVGNVLNSVNISTGLIMEGVKESKVSRLARVVALLAEHASDLGEFITNDSKGRQLPAYLAQLSEHLLADQAAIVNELGSLRRNIDHIKEIVAMQQSYATVGGVKEMINVVNLVEDSLRMNEGALSRHGVELIREFESVPSLNVEKHKILQILVNLIRNAKYACDDSEREDKRLTLRVANGDGRVKISVIDNGVGISPENLTRIFSHGFTTRKGGHGFGLHSGALAAREIGGSLTAHSDGPGKGAVFTLELPCNPPGMATFSAPDVGADTHEIHANA